MTEETNNKSEIVKQEERPRKRLDDNSILVGSKPFMNYVTGTVMQFTSNNRDEVVIKARGRFISRAVDIAEVVTKRFMQGNVEIKSIKTDSEDFIGREGRNARVSAIEIVLAKK